MPQFKATIKLCVVLLSMSGLLSFQVGDGGGGGVWEMERLQAEEMVHPSSNLVNDGVILPHETREVSYPVRYQLDAVHFSICLFVCFLQVLSQCLEVCLRFPDPQVHTRSRHRLNVLRM